MKKSHKILSPRWYFRVRNLLWLCRFCSVWIFFVNRDRLTHTFQTANLIPFGNCGKPCGLPSVKD
jgi:hypothetical protein